MESVLQAFMNRLPDASVDRSVSGFICIQTPHSGYIDIREGVPDGVSCLMEYGGALLVQDDGRLMYVTVSARTDGEFIRCDGYQAAVDAYLKSNGVWAPADVDA